MLLFIFLAVCGGGHTGTVVVESRREEAKAQLQEAMDRVADACTSYAPDEQAYHPNIRLNVSPGVVF